MKIKLKEATEHYPRMLTFLPARGSEEDDKMMTFLYENGFFNGVGLSLDDGTVFAR